MHIFLYQLLIKAYAHEKITSFTYNKKWQFKMDVLEMSLTDDFWAND